MDMRDCRLRDRMQCNVEELSPPDSPVNSSLDYRTCNTSDTRGNSPGIPAVFHNGTGRRGGVRLQSDCLNNLISILENSNSLPKSPLHSCTHCNRKIPSDAVKEDSSSACHSHQLSLMHLSRKHSTIPENEFDAITLARNHSQGSRAFSFETSNPDSEEKSNHKGRSGEHPWCCRYWRFVTLAFGNIGKVRLFKTDHSRSNWCEWKRGFEYDWMDSDPDTKWNGIAWHSAE